MDTKEAKAWFENLEKKVRKGPIRFAFGVPGGPHSNVWTISFNKNDYYISPRHINAKISLHESGECRLALMDAAWKELKDKDIERLPDRAFVKWKRPASPDLDAVCVVRIAFPCDFMRSQCSPSSRSKPIFQFHAPSAGKAAEASFFYSREDPKTLEAKFLSANLQPVFQTHLDNGEWVWFIVREVDFDPAIIPSSEKFNSAGSYVLDPELEIGTQINDLSMMLWDTPKEGGPLQIIEVGGVGIIRNR